MIVVDSPLHLVAVAAETYVPEGCMIRVVFASSGVVDRFSVGFSDDEGHVIALDGNLSMVELEPALIEAMAVAITADIERGPAFCHMRDTLRAAVASWRAA